MLKIILRQWITTYNEQVLCEHTCMWTDRLTAITRTRIHSVGYYFLQSACTSLLENLKLKSAQTHRATWLSHQSVPSIGKPCELTCLLKLNFLQSIACREIKRNLMWSAGNHDLIALDRFLVQLRLHQIACVDSRQRGSSKLLAVEFIMQWLPRVC